MTAFLMSLASLVRRSEKDPFFHSGVQLALLNSNTLVKTLTIGCGY